MRGYIIAGIIGALIGGVLGMCAMCVLILTRERERKSCVICVEKDETWREEENE